MKGAERTGACGASSSSSIANGSHLWLNLASFLPSKGATGGNMDTKASIFAALTSGLVGLVCTGCGSAQMVVPPDVGPATDEIHVDGRSQASGMFVNEDFKIGDFAVAHVSRGSKSTSKFGAFGAFKSDSSTGYSFDLVHGSDTLHGECTS